MTTHDRLPPCPAQPQNHAPSRHGKRWRIVGVLLFVFVLFAMLPGVARGNAHAGDALLPPASEIEQEVGVDLPVNSDPTLERRGLERVPDPRLGELWGAALRRDEAELQAQAARAIAEVHRRGFDGMEQLAPLLARRLDEVEHPLAQVALIEACAALRVRESLPIIERLIRSGDPNVVLAGDEALGVMAHAPAAPLWAQRIGDEEAAITLRRSAIRAMGRLGADARTEPMLAVAQDAKQPQPLRLAAARALADAGRAPDGLVQTVSDLLGQRAWFDRLVGVTMLGSMGERADASLLIRFADDASPVVAAEALRQLGEVRPAACLGLQNAPWRRADTNVRYQAARCLFAHGEPATFEPLAALLDDADPAVRRLAHWSLLRLSMPDGPGDERISLVERTLRDASWRGLERAALLLGHWDHEPAAARLIVLLAHERAEVRVAAAAGLRRLAVTDTLPALLQRAERNTNEMLSLMESDVTPQLLGHLDREQEQLFAAFGVMAYAEADALLRRYVPKDTFSSGSRAAAIWALGKIHRDAPDASLAGALCGRLSDTNPMVPESLEVRSQAAIALARMGGDSQTRAIERFATGEESPDSLRAACRWAIEHLTGEPQPPLQPTEIKPGGDWFLAPLNE